MQYFAGKFIMKESDVLIFKYESILQVLFQKLLTRHILSVVVSRINRSKIENVKKTYKFLILKCIVRVTQYLKLKIIISIKGHK